jgi:catechol 2,3-dioxygenase-like lactoylglutathione lyase family enzyme
VTARTHHVNLPVPAGATDAVARFYVEVLGFAVAPRPESGRTGAWLDVGDGTQVHLTERDGSAHPDQHVAFIVDDFDAVEGRAGTAAAEWTSRGEGRAVVRDPAGNLVELFSVDAAPA